MVISCIPTLNFAKNNWIVKWWNKNIGEDVNEVFIHGQIQSLFFENPTKTSLKKISKCDQKYGELYLVSIKNTKGFKRSDGKTHYLLKKINRRWNMQFHFDKNDIWDASSC